MRTKSVFTHEPIWPPTTGSADHSYITPRICQTVSGSRGSSLWTSNSRLDELFSTTRLSVSNQQSSSNGGQHPSGTRSANGSYVRTSGGRHPDGSPRFNQVVDPGNYLWWYIDGLSDDGLYGFSIIAFVGSVFSPYYAWANQKKPAIADDYCAINVALYTPSKKYWTMTERGQNAIERTAHQFTVGPSHLHWENGVLTIKIRERVPLLGNKVQGEIKVFTEQLFHHVVALDDQEKHRWGPIAPSARVEVAFTEPNIQWHGSAYFDSNEGDEAISKPFSEWDWSRAHLQDGSTAVIYDVRQKNGNERVIASKFNLDGSVESFIPPERVQLRKTGWRIQRNMRSEMNNGHTNIDLLNTFEDTPFYARSMLKSRLLGEDVISMHETLNVKRLESNIVQFMLPWRMPRNPTRIF
jgi:carotenoid 1,2-hydratase